MTKYRCSVCNYIYDESTEGKKFVDLPESWTCPVCGAPKTAFIPEGVSKGDEGIETNVAEKIIEQLVAFGVKYVFGIPGDSNFLINPGHEDFDLISIVSEEPFFFDERIKGNK